MSFIFLVKCCFVRSFSLIFKPDNCLITDFLSAKITDFGTSRSKGAEDITMTAVGTPLYAAPELMRGENYDEKANALYLLWGLLGKTKGM
jgi:serine/threonine protein kinase